MIDYDNLLKIQNYMDKLSENIDPITGNKTDKIELSNNDELKDLFKDVSNLVDTIIQSYYSIVSKNKLKFNLTDEQKKNIKFSINPITITEFTKLINNMINTKFVLKLKTSDISKWLINKGYLSEIKNNRGQTFKKLTPKSNIIGLTSIDKSTIYGEKYQVILYSEKSQKFIIDNIDKIVKK